MGTSCSAFCATCQKERIVELDPQEVNKFLFFFSEIIKKKQIKLIGSTSTQ